MNPPKKIVSGCPNRLLAIRDDRIKTLESALREARMVLKTATKYFPKSIRNPDRFNLINVLANSVIPALERNK